MNNQKQNLGQFNTKNDVWLRPHVYDFIKSCGCSRVVDPYAGAGDLLAAANQIVWEVIGYDIDPSLGWPENDSLLDIPYHNDAIVITNPPYLAKNSANRNGFDSYKYFKHNDYEDLYQLAIDKVLEKYKNAVFIIPETYFQSSFFKEYLVQYTIIEENPFTDTDCPVCVACFSVDNNFFRFTSNEYKIYKNDVYLFTNHDLEDILFSFKTNLDLAMDFNVSNGNLGLRGVDGVSPDNRIRFCHPWELGYELDDVKESSRSITAINIPHLEINERFINLLNKELELLRKKTYDVVLSPFKNNNRLGIRRRRLDYALARKLINLAATIFYYKKF